mgnify:CR=1 FL=1|tara:strand:- start:7626 stop:9203 length:1578 start_codon:yes stop_codon:yes gene_type:complete
MAKRSVGEKIDVQRFGYERASGLDFVKNDDRTSTISYGDGDNKETKKLSLVVTPEMEVEEVDADGNPTKLKPTGKQTTVIYDCETYTQEGNRTTGDQIKQRAVSQENIDNGKCTKIASKTTNPEKIGDTVNPDYNEETNNRWIVEEGVDIPERLKDELEAGGTTTASRSVSDSERKIKEGDRRVRAEELKSDDPLIKATAEALEALKEKGELDQTSGGLTTANTNGVDALLNVGKKRRDSYTNSAGISYPKDLKNQDYIEFKIYEYSPRKLSTTNTKQAGIEDRTPATKRDDKGTIRLPIPGNIQDSNGVEWAKGDINPLQAEVAAAALGFISGGENSDTVTTNFKEKIMNNKILGDAKTVTANLFTARATKTKGLLSRATGAVINPNSELLFKGPKLRTFNFSYELSARDEDEAKIIVNIIRAFKQASSVQKSKTRIFLGAPCTFTIKYRNPENKEHKFIGKIKECALVNIAVNYAPAQYSTYNDGCMTKYNLTLQFQELEPVHNSDYMEWDEENKDNINSIGY